MYRIGALLLLLIPLSVSARINIYLIPEVETDKKEIVLSDIAGIDGDEITAAGKISIPHNMYKDMLIDRSELNGYLASELKGNYAIFGNGVRLNFKKDEIATAQETKEEKPVLIKKGDNVDLVIRNKGISIELRGRAMQGGTEDDEIDVRLKNGKIFKGRPFESGKVAVNL